MRLLLATARTVKPQQAARRVIVSTTSHHLAGGRVADLVVLSLQHLTALIDVMPCWLLVGCPGRTQQSRQLLRKAVAV
jgi:hypothetical protein